MPHEGAAGYSLAHQEFMERYGLGDEEKGVLDALVEAKSRGVECLKGTQLLTLVYGQTRPSEARVRKLLGRESRLRKLGLLICQGISSKRDLRDSTFALSWSTLNELISGEERPFHEEKRPKECRPSVKIMADSSAPAPYLNNREYIADQLKRVHLYEKREELIFGRDYSAELGPDRRRRRDSKLINGAIEGIEHRIRARLGMTKVEFPLERWRRVYELSEKEVLAFLIALSHHLRHDRWLYDRELLRSISRHEIEVMENRKILRDDAPLFKHNILAVEMERFSVKEIRVNESKLDELLGDQPEVEDTDEGESDTFVELQKLCTGKTFELIRPSASLHNVVLPELTLRQIQLVLSSLRGGTQRTLGSWGTSTGRIRPGKDRPRDGYSLTLLFSGEPGTGKTLTAEAVAHKLNRGMLSVDCSTVLSCWVGESQQNTKRIFREYTEICRDCKPEPILFLDEVDQLFSMRTDVRQSADRMHNQMQNILLQSMDSFSGILIATTNLVENLDPAFSRRFQFKIEFPRPDVRARLKLWRLHLAGAPLARGVDLGAMARRYELSGGQIALSAKNAALRAATRRPKERMITQDDLESAVTAELTGAFGHSSKARIGFHQ